MSWTAEGVIRPSPPPKRLVRTMSTPQECVNLTLQQFKPKKPCIHKSLGLLYFCNHPTAPTTPFPVSLPSQGDTLASVLSVQHTHHLAEHHLVYSLFHAHTQIPPSRMHWHWTNRDMVKTVYTHFSGFTFANL